MLKLTAAVLGCAFLALLNPPTTQPAGNATDDPAVVSLATQLTGSFGSTAQSQQDPDYFDIRLHMTRIWAERTDGIWLYVEQATAPAPARPYRQRIYQVHRRGDGKLVSEVFLLPGTMPEQQTNFAGAWKDATKLAALTPEKLTHKAGCAMVLDEKPDGTFEGGTQGKNCPSELRGATYATSEAVITPKGLRTWDRGYNATDKQVWGAEKGPYIFDRQ
jgi:hypothetical protein